MNWGNYGAICVARAHPLDNNVDLMDDLFGMRGDDVLDISGEVPACSKITQDNLATGGD